MSDSRSQLEGSAHSHTSDGGGALELRDYLDAVPHHV